MEEKACGTVRDHHLHWFSFPFSDMKVWRSPNSASSAMKTPPSTWSPIMSISSFRPTGRMCAMPFGEVRALSLSSFIPFLFQAVALKPGAISPNHCPYTKVVSSLALSEGFITCFSKLVLGWSLICARIENNYKQNGWQFNGDWESCDAFSWKFDVECLISWWLCGTAGHVPCYQYIIEEFTLIQGLWVLTCIQYSLNSFCGKLFGYNPAMSWLLCEFWERASSCFDWSPAYSCPHNTTRVIVNIRFPVHHDYELEIANSVKHEQNHFS